MRQGRKCLTNSSMQLLLDSYPLNGTMNVFTSFLLKHDIYHIRKALLKCYRTQTCSILDLSVLEEHVSIEGLVFRKQKS